MTQNGTIYVRVVTHLERDNDLPGYTTIYTLQGHLGDRQWTNEGVPSTDPNDVLDAVVKMQNLNGREGVIWDEGQRTGQSS